jgi:hypothetical protein
MGTPFLTVVLVSNARQATAADGGDVLKAAVALATRAFAGSN